ncbi:MAG: ABC transporter ATP-binding protein [Lachnospirales bacterium]
MIEVKNLVKKYGSNIAVDNLSFTVNPGEILGFLGSNGAGKTTTMNIMTGYLAATSGDVLINNIDIVEQPEICKKNIGYLPDVPPLYPEMTVMEYLSFVYDLKKLPKANKIESINKIIDQVKIKDMCKRLTKNLSKGYKQRVGLAQAMLGSPEILILDEPTSGLDPKQIIEMRNVVKSLSKTHTIILSSHILSEVSAMCDRVMIINNGKMVAVDTPDNLAAKLNTGSETLVRIKGDKNLAREKLLNISFIEDVKDIGSLEEGTYDLVIKGEEGIDIRESVSKTLISNSIALLMIKPQDLSLEKIFLQITKDNIDLTAPKGTEEVEASEINTETDIENTLIKEDE